MLSIGLTGGIGSGKSTVAKLFQNQGIPVYNADLAARRIVDGDPEVQHSIKSTFGEGFFDQGVLNRKKLADLVFSSPDALEKLNNIVHPSVRADYTDWLTRQNTPYVLREAAILLESGADKDCDKIILVLADKETRIKRIMLRDDVSREDVLKRMENQWSDERKIPHVDFIIRNDGNDDLMEQVAEIHRKLLNQAEEKNEDSKGRSNP